MVYRALVSGNLVLAERGELTVLLGPRAASRPRCPAMAAYSRAQHYLGEAEQARFAKLAINLMIAVSAGMMAEALAFARKGGVDFAEMLDLLGDKGRIADGQIRQDAAAWAGDYSSTFSCRQMARIPTFSKPSIRHVEPAPLLRSCARPIPP